MELLLYIYIQIHTLLLDANSSSLMYAAAAAKRQTKKGSNADDIFAASLSAVVGHL